MNKDIIDVLKEAEPCGYCDDCGQPIYNGDKYAKIGTMIYCKECFDNYIKIADGEL